jgi:adenosylmethionine-8-amino-7-oxononanoate aminotransferase
MSTTIRMDGMKSARAATVVEGANSAPGHDASIATAAERPMLAPAHTARLRASAARHLWMHFAKVGADAPMIVRGDGCYVWDAEGRRYLDGLSALFCVNAGHGRAEIAEAVARQMRELAFYHVWGYTHPPAIELAERIAGLAPAGLERVFFTSGGSEAVESAIKLSRNLFRLRGEPERMKIIARETAYHGTTLGALSATGIPAIREQFAPILPGACHVPNTNTFRADPGRDPLWAADQIEERILREGPETVAAVVIEPIQNAGGCITPPPGYWARVREICDRHGVLLIADEVITAWGRIGHWFGVERFGGRPDLITTAKGLTSAYAPMGAVIVSDGVVASFADADFAFAHGLTFGAHPGAAAAAQANLDVFERENLCGRVSGHFKRCSNRFVTSRSSVTCAVPATSGRSSSCATRTPRSGSTDPSMTGCSARSSGPACAKPACSREPTTGGTPSCSSARR